MQVIFYRPSVDEWYHNFFAILNRTHLQLGDILNIIINKIRHNFARDIYHAPFVILVKLNNFYPYSAVSIITP